MTESEMRNAKVPWFESINDVMSYINDLVGQPHDYGTCVYAMSMAAVAALNYVAGKLGVTGFQASCADMDILTRTREYKSGFMIIDYDHIFYPQYLTNEYFPSPNDIIAKNKVWFAKRAKELLKETDMVSGSVIDRWKYLASLATDKEIAELDKSN